MLPVLPDLKAKGSNINVSESKQTQELWGSMKVLLLVYKQHIVSSISMKFTSDACYTKSIHHITQVYP